MVNFDSSQEAPRTMDQAIRQTFIKMFDKLSEVQALTVATFHGRHYEREAKRNLEMVVSD